VGLSIASGGFVSFPVSFAWPALAASFAVLAAVMALSPLRAKEVFILGPGSTVGPSTEVKPVNCVTAADRSITCDTKLENPPSDTPARPDYQPFPN